MFQSETSPLESEIHTVLVHRRGLLNILVNPVVYAFWLSSIDRQMVLGLQL